MTTKTFVNLLFYVEPLLCAALLVALAKARSVRRFVWFTALIAVRLASLLAGLTLSQLCQRNIHAALAYASYFYVYWFSYAIESVLSIFLVYSIFRLAMAPLKGLADLGILVFRWAGAISIAVAFGVAFIPHQSNTKFLITTVTQLQQTSSILTLCLLLFVCFAIRPLGLTYRSRIFGVSLGLGVLATTELARAAWLSHTAQVYSAINIISGLAAVLTFLIWTAYFAIPEPERKMIIVPTTSPYLKWNQISEVLGDEPGYVAIGAFHPSLFAEAEWEIMGRASAKMASTFPDTSADHKIDSTFNPAMLSRSA